MKLIKVLSTTLVAIVAMTFFVAAKTKDSRNMVLYYEATVGGSHLASGPYSVKWETRSPEATVSFVQGNKIVATAPGKLVDRGKKYLANEVVFNMTPDGARTIREIRFRDSSEVIEFNP
jgi:hypothetical protein